MTAEKKISIVIPMYNAGHLIEECLTSIANQTYRNYEVFIIDDGSSDNSPELVSNFSKSNQNFNYVLIKNGGANNARNVGLNYCTGDYVIFVDQDDFFTSKNVFQELIEIFKNLPETDFIIYKYVEYFQKSNIYKKRPDFGKLAVDEKRTTFDQLYSFVSNGNIPISPWDKIFNRQFLINKNINFPVGLIAGDINWFIELIEKSNNIVVLNAEYYAYRRQVSSSLTNSFSLKSFLNFLEIIEDESARLKNKEKDNFTELFCSFLAYEYSILLGLSSNLNKVEFEKYHDRIKALKWLFKFDINKKVRKVKLLINLVGIRITSKILSFYIRTVVNKN
jgi:glycosyltransferase involved in cell wall biosynthesis